MIKTRIGLFVVVLLTLTSLLVSLPVSAQVEKATVKIDGMI